MNARWLILAALFVGCGAAVDRQEFERLKSASAQKDAQLRSLSMKLKGKGIEARALTKELKLIRSSIPSAEKHAREGLIKELAAMNIKVTERGPELVVTLAGKVLFPPGRTSLTKEAKKALRDVADTIRSKGLRNVIRIEGHSDSSPVRVTKNIYEDNLSISFHRARKAHLFLVEECGLPRNQAYVAAFGDSRPVYSNTTARGRDQNRRVEIVILPAVMESRELLN